MPRFRRVARDTRPVHATALALAALPLLGATLPCVVSAEEAPAATAGGASYLTLGEVTVSASRTGVLSARDVLSSVDILGAERVQDQQVDNAWELFTRAPGVMTTDFNQGTTSGKFSFRAFNGEGEINAVKLLVDGIPSNSNDGNMPYIDLIFPLDIESIEIVRGTNDARYGLHNIAGNAGITTRTGGNYTQGRVSYGSYDTVDTQWSAGLERGGFAQNYFVAYRGSEGFREHSDFDKFTFAGKWFYAPDSQPFRAGLIIRWFENDAEEPGYLTEADARRRPEFSYPFSATDGGERQVGTVSGHLDVDVAQDLVWTLKSYVNLLDDTRWVKFSAAVSQQERITNETHYGAISTLTWRPAVPRLDDFAIEGGIDVQQQDNESERYLGTARVRQRQTRDQAFDLTNYGGYAQMVVKPVSWLKFVPGVRVDRYEGDFEDLLNRSTADINDYGTIWQPKVAAVVTPLAGYDVYGNWGRSAQIGLAAGTYKIAPRLTDLEPSINDGWEVGLKFQPAPWLDGRLAYWEQVASDEVRRKLNDPTGDFDNVGETERTGVDLQLNVAPTSRLDAWFAWSVQDAEVLTPGPTEPALRGKEIDHTPDFILSGGIDYAVTDAFRTSVWTYAQGDYYPERTNATDEFGDYFVLNLLLAYDVTKQIGLEFQVRNLTDEYYEYVWHDGTQTLHSPGDDRTFFGAVNLRFDY
jgi:iron complex outermembrane receptor protein